jgi:hypothetical protein
MDRNKTNLSKYEKEKLKVLIAIGTPEIYRSKLWILCSGAKKQINENPHYYNNLKKLSLEVPSLHKNQIEKDIKRTKTLSKEPNFFEKLKNILICYSIRNSSIGYCQGFNFIAERLLYVLKDEVKILFILILNLYFYF